MPMRPDIHRSVRSPEFQELGQRYYQYWGNDSLHLIEDEHRQIRIAFCNVIKNIPTDGVVAFCGTGPRIALERDLDSTLVGGHLADRPELVFADFSQEMLGSSYRTVEDISTTVAANSHLVIRDFSRGNLGAKFDTIMKDRIENIRTPRQMEAFINFVRNETGLNEIRKQPLPKDRGRIDPRLIAKPDAQEGLQFDKVLFEQQPIRLIVANLLISGMFAVTEMEFRSKLAWLRKEFPSKMTPEKMIDCLAAWHALILLLNEQVGKDFIEDALQANAEIDGSTPTVFLSADDTVTYTNLQGFDRIRMKELQAKIPQGAAMREIDRTHWNHSHEEIPHKHTVSVAVISEK